MWPLPLLLYEEPNHLWYSRLNLTNQACEQRWQITFWENNTCTQCPSLSTGISNSRLLQQCFRKLVAIHWFDLCIPNFIAPGSLTLETNAQCVTEVSHPENISKPSLPGSFAVFVCYTVFLATIGLKLYFCSGGDGFACVPSVYMTLCFYDEQISLHFSVPICLLTMFIWGSDWDRAWWRFKHVHTQTWRQINKHSCTHTSKRVPGIVTFHISFKSIRDYSPLFRKETR